MPGLLPDVDPDGLLEYSVVFSDRALNHMSRTFQGVMNDISRTLKHVYRGKSAIVVPGSGTFGMEAVARQFGTGRRCLVIRNGWFSYRWSQIFDMGSIPSESIVLKARRSEAGKTAPYAPVPIGDVVAAIREHRPALVCAPHVETASGIILPDAYLRAIADEVHAVGGLFVLDCIASGALWVDMGASGVDVLISAPQKGWSSSACCALVVLSERARAAIDGTTSTSFACDLRKWLQIMETYEGGGHAYYATMPTDSLARLREAMRELDGFGFDAAKAAQQDLGARVRKMLVAKGMASVAAPGFQAPSVVVSYTDDADIQSGRKLIGLGLQTAAGVPLQCDEPADFMTFRIGLFGLDKLRNVERTVRNLDTAFSQLMADA
ncbi:MAG TPA: alanine--glyoxylate aminotransferase family protein [Casimicrobiaceae bacterium]|nr:alanine--glyoxylate aminotransferase family protein [Casimicrobiaceae bacterium]